MKITGLLVLCLWLFSLMLPALVDNPAPDQSPPYTLLLHGTANGWFVLKNGVVGPFIDLKYLGWYGNIPLLLSVRRMVKYERPAIFQAALGLGLAITFFLPSHNVFYYGVAPLAPLVGFWVWLSCFVIIFIAAFPKKIIV